MKTRETDVLIIGSGAAGLRAAIEARRQKVDTLLVSKAKIGWNNCTAYGGGGFSAPLGGMSPEQYFDLIVTAGKKICDENLVETLVNEAARRLIELQKFGVKLTVYHGGCKTSGPTVMGGLGLTQPLATYAEKIGVRMLENFLIFSILTGETVEGAIGVHIRNGEGELLKAKAIILATGGGGEIFKRNDNPVRTTGDGYALAYNIGIPLIDMEFVQCHPIGFAEKGYPNYMFPVSHNVLELGVLQNIDGEDIMKKYELDPKLIYYTARDAWTNSIAREIHEGRGEGDTVLLNLRNIPQKQRTKLITNGTLLAVLQPLTRRVKSFPFEVKPLHVSPVVHSFMGGIQINEKCETLLPGFYAVGEVTGGIHGANRVGGAAFTNCIVYGRRAGYYAAKYAGGEKKPEIDLASAEQELKDINQILRHAPCQKGKPSRIKHCVQSIMWRYAGIIRNKHSLDIAERELQKLEEEAIPVLYASNPYELMTAVETLNILAVGKIITRAAQTRTETRGVHYRTDHPHQDDQRWLQNVVILKEKKNMKAQTKPVTLREKIF